MPDATRHLTLANGLHLTLRHAPRLKRAAAALRVQAGSHDAAARWPGLAHFLEHLFFLGTERFPLDDGLMRYVQGVGGQVNASTRERTTDFFFEVPPAALAGGLERLCQMLAEPDLSLARQVSEREVIHAEFIAWSRNREAQSQFALLQRLSADHPLRGFHAGNRHSLNLHNPQFQRELRGFHQRFYQGGQMVLSLCGPQSLDQLQALSERYASIFASGQRVVQALPPALLEQALVPPTPEHGQLDLLFAHEGLPAGAQQALDLLQGCISDSREGTWLAALRQRGWVRECQPQLLYAFAGQLLWTIHVRLTDTAQVDEVRALLHGWLQFIRQADFDALNAAYAHLQQRRAMSASALELAQRDSHENPLQALDAPSLQALTAILDGLPLQAYGSWQLPPADPLLLASLPDTTAALPAALSISTCLPSSRQYAALYLRWRIATPLRQRLHAVLVNALRPLTERAEQASLQMDFSSSGEYWQLRCAGLPAAVLRLVAEALSVLHQPDADCWQAPIADEPGLIPIRALLKRWPDAVANAPTAQAEPAGVLDQAILEQVWQSTRCQGLAVGFGDPELAALGSAVARTMWDEPAGQERLLDTSTVPGKRWLHADVAGSEHALLLFCPLPPQLQGAGRLLAQLLQGPVYQRLRVELQLGYAVFSALRQTDGIGGLLFGVQSPHVRPAQILAHLLEVLSAGVTLDSATRQALADGLVEAAMPDTEVAQWAWQSYLADDAGDLEALRAAILNTDQSDLDALLAALLAAQYGWLCLANSPAPESGWQ
nr:pyrroloquinoline quinone biosynthesis protein PqqF [uncultured Pseudomonas sp.]